MKTRQNWLGRAVARRTEADMRDDLLRYWGARRGAGQIRYVLGSAQPLRVSFSFRGLAVALDNFVKSAAGQ